MTFQLIHFVETAEFDPAAFQLPDSLKNVTGPEVQEPVGLSPQAQILEQQLSREIHRVQQLPEATNQQIVQNIQQQVHVNASDMRAEQVKKLLLKLKALSPELEIESLRNTLLENMQALQTCYASTQIPKDLATMSVLHPLLKCQAAKWDALKAGKNIEIPTPEASYIQKLRQLKGGLGPVERAALMQWVLALNHHLAKFQVQSTPVVSESEQAAEPPSVTTQPVSKPSAPAVSVPASDTVFDPLQASRLLMQLRAKLQRTFSTQEKQDLQAQIQLLEAQQKAFFEQKQIQALNKQIQEFQTDRSRFEQAKFSAATFESWRKLRLTSLQNILRLFAQDANKQDLSTCFESAQKQLARLGMNDAAEWIARERKTQAAFSDESALYQALLSWQQSFGRLIDQALGFTGVLGLQTQVAEFKAQLQKIEQIKNHWQAQQAKLQTLEADYRACQDPVKQHQLKQELLQFYAELFADLPVVPLA